jgi:hypothetical protein
MAIGLMNNNVYYDENLNPVNLPKNFTFFQDSQQRTNELTPKRNSYTFPDVGKIGSYAYLNNNDPRMGAGNRTTPYSVYTTPKQPYSALPNGGNISYSETNPLAQGQIGAENSSKDVYAKPAYPSTGMTYDASQQPSSPQVPPNQLGKNLLNFATSGSGQALGRGLLEASGYSGTPMTFGQALAQGMQYMGDADKLEADKKQQDFLNNLKLKELELTEKGLTASSKDTADIKNYKFYKNLNTDQQKQWDKLKKQDPEFASELAKAVESVKQGMTDGVVLSAADIAFDKASAEKLSEFYLTEYPQQLTNLGKIDDVINIMKNQDVTGPVTGGMPFALRVLVNPDSVGIEDDIKSIIYQSLRATLGAQFTQREGENLVQATFNKYLDEETNIKRLERLRTETINGLETKVSMYNHLKEEGTLKEWQGSKLLSPEEYKNNKREIQNNIFDISDYAGLTGDKLLEIASSDISQEEKDFIANNIELINDTYNLGLE